MCRMGDTEQCRELVMGWVVDTNNKQEMAVRTEDGWRRIMVGDIISIIVTIILYPSFLSLETPSPGRTSRTSGTRRRTSKMKDNGHVIEDVRMPGSRTTASMTPPRSPVTSTTATAGATTTPSPSPTDHPQPPATGAW